MDFERHLQRTYWESVDSHGDRRSPDHPVITAFARPKLKIAAQYGAFRDGNTVLDVGCGNGFFTHHIPANVYTVGLDFSRTMLSLNPSSELVQGSALALPFSTASFDTVICSNLLHHLDDPQAAVDEMARVSRRFLVLSEPHRNNPGMFLFGVVKREERGTLKFTPNYMHGLARHAGLRVKTCRALGMIFPNKTPVVAAPFLSRFDESHPLGAYILLVAEKDAA